MKKQRREPYDPPHVIHDSLPKKFATAGKYLWTPTDDSEPGRNRRRKFLKHVAEKILKDCERQRLVDEDTERRKRAAEIFERVAKDKVLLALEKAFDERLAEIQRYYLSEHEKEAKAGDKRRQEELTKILKRINQDTFRLEREELTRRGVVRSRR